MGSGVLANRFARTLVNTCSRTLASYARRNSCCCSLNQLSNSGHLGEDVFPPRGVKDDEGPVVKLVTTGKVVELVKRAVRVPMVLVVSVVISGYSEKMGEALTMGVSSLVAIFTQSAGRNLSNVFAVGVPRMAPMKKHGTNLNGSERSFHRRVVWMAICTRVK